MLNPAVGVFCSFVSSLKEFLPKNLCLLRHGFKDFSIKHCLKLRFRL